MAITLMYEVVKSAKEAWDKRARAGGIMYGYSVACDVVVYSEFTVRGEWGTDIHSGLHFSG